tara:strand:- start:113 stop:364 length:252 start_codon:yes stop_codon:yes gene_type:complete
MVKVSSATDWGAGLKRIDAARYCGHSPGHFDKLVKNGIYPQGRNADGVVIWLRWELDEALADLPSYGDEGANRRNSCDEAFGC